MNGLARLIVDEKAKQDLSYRDMARRSRGKVSSGYFNGIANGKYDGQVSDEKLRGIAEALDLPFRTVAEAAGKPVDGPLIPFQLPAKASRLSARSRRAVLSVVDALLAAEEGE